MSDFVGPLNVFFLLSDATKRPPEVLGDTFEEMAERLEEQEYGQ